MPQVLEVNIAGLSVRRSAERLGMPYSLAVDVAEPCSGLRSLFALMALTAGYAYFNQPTWARRALLFACSIPLAVAGNVARIVSICVLASSTDPQFATGFYHDYSGYIVFIVAIVLMVVAGELIDRLFGTVRKSPEHGAAEPAPPCCGCGGSAWAHASAAAFFAAVFLFQAYTPPAMVAKAPEVSFPEIAGYETDDEKYAEEQKISEAERKVLPRDTSIVKKVYVSPAGARMLVSYVIGGTSRASIHRPELCLPSQGFVMSR